MDQQATLTNIPVYYKKDKNRAIISKLSYITNFWKIIIMAICLAIQRNHNHYPYALFNKKDHL